MIQVGINENVVLKSAAIADKGYLKIEVRQKGNSEQASADDPFAMASAGQAIDVASSTSLTILKLLVPKATKTNGDARTRAERVSMSNNDLIETMNKCKHILSCFITSDDIAALYANVYMNTNFSMEIYKAQGAASFEDLLLDQDRMDIVSTNIFNAFISGITPFLDKDEHAVRLKLIRQSKEKHYGTIPGARYISTDPFMESMLIPVEQSKVKFSAYEIKNGLNDGTPTTQAAADATPAAPPMSTDASPFGQR